MPHISRATVHTTDSVSPWIAIWATTFIALAGCVGFSLGAYGPTTNVLWSAVVVFICFCSFIWNIPHMLGYTHVPLSLKYFISALIAASLYIAFFIQV